MCRGNSIKNTYVFIDKINKINTTKQNNFFRYKKLLNLYDRTRIVKNTNFRIIVTLLIKKSMKIFIWLTLQSINIFLNIRKKCILKVMILLQVNDLNYTYKMMNRYTY